MAVKRAKLEEIDKDMKMQDYPYFGQLLPYALSKITYHMCFKCQKPYFGGLKNPENEQQQDYQNLKAEELVCGYCSADAVGGGIEDCKTHGSKHIVFKCKLCCNRAEFHFQGKFHLCSDCNNKQKKTNQFTKGRLAKLKQCKGKNRCPLKIDHPKNGTEEYALG